jgi:saccharopine dehydrogenase-like NADP-dependent oxidoreductase
MKILLLGVGLQGKAALYHLVNSSAVAQIIAADVNYGDLITYVNSLKTDKVIPIKLDVHDYEQESKQMKLVQAVIVLLPQQFRLEMATLAIENNIHFIEASYTLPEYSKLDNRAKERNVTLLPECGLDPGIDLVLTGHAIREFDTVHELHAYGTGIPEQEAVSNPLKYKISWTFAGVLNAYQRPARFLKNGKVIDLTPDEIFDPGNVHMVDVERIGQLEAYYNGDSIKYLDILQIKDTVTSAGRYSLRWPGHSAFWRKMVQLGFLKEDPIKVGEQEVSPRQFVHDLLLPQLQYEEHERDVAAIRIEVTGLKNGQRKRIVYQMIDRRDLKTGLLASTAYLPDVTELVGLVATAGIRAVSHREFFFGTAQLVTGTRA